MISIKGILTCLLICPLLSSCSHRPEVVSVASIATSSDWRVEPTCGYEHCYPLVDFLVSKELKVRVEPENKNKDGIFTILVQFITPESSNYFFNPSTSSLKLMNEGPITSHDFPCSGTIYSSTTFKSENYMKKPIKLDGYVHKGWRYDCFRMYFDAYAPRAEEAFALKIQGLEKDGAPVAIPPVHFSKGMR
jgi:hypothetical protein